MSHLRALCWLLITVAVPLVEAFPQTGPASSKKDLWGDFPQRIEVYLKVRKSLPRLKTTRDGGKIVDRRHALGQAIRNARPDAKQGDIFTPEISEQFLRVIRDTFQGSRSASVRRTVRQGEPVAGLVLAVNGAYPEAAPLTTVPPTLLRRLPRLPERLAYRIVDRGFVLEDTEARLIVDFIPGAIP